MEENKDYQSSMEYSYGGGNATVQAPVKENVFLGAVGALAGTLIGVICIVITGQLGYVSALCGVVMGVCALRGYQMLGKTVSKKGIIITLIIMIVMIYVSNWITYAIAVSDVYDVDFFTAFQATPEIIRVGDVASAYYKDLAMLYLFTALGAFSTIKKCFK